MAALSSSELLAIAGLLDKLEEMSMGHTAPDGATFVSIEEVCVNVNGSNTRVRLAWDDGTFCLTGKSVPMPETPLTE